MSHDSPPRRRSRRVSRALACGFGSMVVRAGFAAGFAGASFSAIAGQSKVVSPNPENFGQFGQSVAGVPDFDGDGRGDFAVGAHRETVGGLAGAGRAYLFKGPTRTFSRQFESPNPETDGRFGAAAAGVSDTNGDGSGDLLVGARLEDGGATDAGRAYLFDGLAGNLLHTFVSPAAQASGEFGASVAGVPDATGDARGDVLIGAPLEDTGGTDAGRAYLFDGSTGTLSRALGSPNPEAFGHFGVAVAGVPDANGDGRGDLLVGAELEDGGTFNSGRAYLFDGATGAHLHTLTTTNPTNGGRFGFSVAGMPDADGDGRGDLLVGAPEETAAALPDAGRAYLFGGATGALLRPFVSPAPQNTGLFGYSVAGIDDWNGGGRGDALIGAPQEDVSLTNEGRAYLFDGTSGLLLETFAAAPPQNAGQFGNSAAGLADADGDGRGDAVVGAFAENEVFGDDGRAHFFGTVMTTPTPSPTASPSPSASPSPTPSPSASPTPTPSPTASPSPTPAPAAAQAWSAYE